jgi:hypothetical protein
MKFTYSRGKYLTVFCSDFTGYFTVIERIIPTQFPRWYIN